MTAAALPLLRVSGTPDEIGEVHGRLASDAVARNLDVYFRRFVDEAELTRDEVLRRTARLWKALPPPQAGFARMVEGIAAGARQPVLDVAAINFRFELLYGEFSRIGRRDLGSAPAPAGDCTAFAVLPEVSADGHLWIGQNWDWIPEVAGLLLHVTLEDGRRVLCFTEAGIAGGKIGLNSDRVGLVVNGLLSDRDDWQALGVPFHARTWAVLTSPTLAAARAAVDAPLRACSANYLVAQATGPGRGEAVSLEAAPTGVCEVRPTAGTLAHANHFLDPDRLGIWQPLVEDKRSTYHRCRRMEHLLADARGTAGLDAGALQAILRDHAERPDSICRHPNPALPEAERYATVVSVIMDLHDGIMLAAPGTPCTAVYTAYRV